jgi:hypothetical protein
MTQCWDLFGPFPLAGRGLLRTPGTGDYLMAERGMVMNCRLLQLIPEYGTRREKITGIKQMQSLRRHGKMSIILNDAHLAETGKR